MKFKCDCGGEMRYEVVPEYDFSVYAGVPAVLHDAKVLKCQACGEISLDGRLINSAMTVLVLTLVRSPERLGPEAARFLRKSIGLTQEELATRMGIVRGTVAKWEAGEDISPQHDLILRQLALSGLNIGDDGRLLEAQRELNAVRLAPPRDHGPTVIRATG